MNWHVRSPLAVAGCLLAAGGCLAAGFALLSPVDGVSLALICAGGALAVIAGVAIVIREMRRG